MKTPSSSRRGGFSLAETMLAMVLVLGVLGMVAVLMREYSDVSRFADERDNAFDGVQFALTEMANEVSSAVVMIAPSKAANPESTSSRLDFERMDPGIERFKLMPPTGSGIGGGFGMDEPPELVVWDYRDPQERMQVIYSKEDSGELVRTLKRKHRPEVKQTLTSSVNSMVITKKKEGFLKIKVAFQEDKRTRTFEVQARVWSRL